MDCEVKYATFTRITFPSQKKVLSGKIILCGKFFLSGNYFHRNNLKKKIITFPQHIFSNKVAFFDSKLAQCINSSKTNGNRPNLNQINQ